ncbi:TetR family transcriptional regulator [Melghirimyces profundicolus]|uniref:TetR family transcriptional regulator n=1 Tax=Melghirimyces profundicolus TaxID=1242148 RepID=A0A2T6BU99_9BACL|nr:TetR/AcrR family transcriptional regulator [Melghirimyces profundicolus]PTX59642.1 TetR family transcriptional regulator [Melghirimyces profundicolus]
MPRSPEQNRAIREKRIQQILEAAVSVYRERGYHGAEMGAIARRAGLGRGLIYYYFKDKRDVFISLIRLTLQRWKDVVGEITRSEGSVTERLGRILKQTCALSLEHPDYSYFHQTISRDIKVLFPDREAEVNALYEESMWKPIRSLLREGVEKGELAVDPELGERFIFSVLFGAVNHENMIDKEKLDQWVTLALYGLVKNRNTDT